VSSVRVKGGVVRSEKYLTLLSLVGGRMKRSEKRPVPVGTTAAAGARPLPVASG